MNISLKAYESSTYSLRVGRLLCIFIYRCKILLLLERVGVRTKNPPLSSPHDPRMLKFMIRSTLCLKINGGEAHGWGTFAKMWGRIWLPLHPRPLFFWECPPPTSTFYLTLHRWAKEQDFNLFEECSKY